MWGPWDGTFRMVASLWRFLSSSDRQLCLHYSDSKLFLTILSRTEAATGHWWAQLAYGHILFALFGIWNTFRKHLITRTFYIKIWFSIFSDSIRLVLIDREYALQFVTIPDLVLECPFYSFQHLPGPVGIWVYHHCSQDFHYFFLTLSSCRRHLHKD